jgi:hypothetical protein
MSFPSWNPAAVTSTTRCSVGWVTEFQVQCSLFQKEMKRGMWAMSAGAAFGRASTTTTAFDSVASFLHVTQTTLGTVVLSHEHLASVLSSQHHDMTHDSAHFTAAAADPVTTASAARPGLLSAPNCQKISTLEVSVTRNKFIATSYVGDGAASQLVSLGHQPNSILLWGEGANAPAFEYIYGARYMTRHKISTLAHQMEVASDFVATHQYGFCARASCNQSGSTYWVWAPKEW